MLIFDCFSYIIGEGGVADHVTVSDTLRRFGRLDPVGGESFLMGLSENSPNPLLAEQYAKHIKRDSALRKLKEKATKLLKASKNGKNWRMRPRTVLTLSDEAERLNASAREDSGTGFFEAMDEYAVSQLDGEIPRMKTGFIQIDRILSGGFAKGDYIILGGRSGMGKSAIAIDMVRKACKGKFVLFFHSR